MTERSVTHVDVEKHLDERSRRHKLCSMESRRPRSVARRPTARRPPGDKPGLPL
jgi:hypothetical protein